MGLVGCMLSPVANQLSADYLKTEDFARRPLAWLDLVSRNPGTTLSYSPTFGYDICSRRLSSITKVEDRFDLSRWRIAGNGADMIRPDVMQAFVDGFADAGFKAQAFCPSYGLAEATLAVSIMPPGEGIRLELVEESELSGAGTPAQERPRRYRAIVNCGKPVIGMEVEVRDGDGSVMDERGIGKLFCRGSSVMDGYFRDPEATDACLSADKWLDTGDMGYISGGYIFIVGRAKDMIIINGRNHWPQDIEWAVEQLPGFKSGDIAAFRHYRPERRGNPGGAGPLPGQRRRRAQPPARRHPRAGPRHHRHHPGGRTRPAAHPAAHQFGQTQPHQSAQPLPQRRNRPVRRRGVTVPPPDLG